jgi:hypothetical protein
MNRTWLVASLLTTAVALGQGREGIRGELGVRLLRLRAEQARRRSLG